ncbi:methionine ABC transporter ATP-binding protein [Pseudoclavibacter chungangensis]|uniref:Methionine ABC transporter ATP-binding protein n=1 Tax=Pseudoclavibacter chungangensis TaxID=587635 RepID=A0A7J5BPY6_9MICO|nr:methionine ABC transporter ATP-binding protein [Pseudoclavibacter chungangensis]KAB1655351.1 methionine ABC transporter ATP-binding protein [Pseudoclavibacter chungangensis]NYJ68301.1 D-methionine transport system ATP-binding protein [Pseudoclavibacter chungangensis]
MALISLRDVVKEYPSSARNGVAVRAVDGVSLDIQAGDIYGMIGYSGAGKSTLVRLVNALEPATSGVIEVDGVNLVGLPERDLRPIRSGIGMIFQQFNLFNSRTVAGNVAYPLRVAKWEKAAREKRVAELLDFVGLADKAGNYPDQLSGGQKQRVGIARALATQPRILLADEATSALDPQTTSDVLALLQKVNRELGVTIIVITHEMDVIKSIATHVAVMESGRVVERGEVFDVFSNPQAPATRRFVSTVVQGIPNPHEIRELSERYPSSRLIAVSVRSGGTEQAEVFRRLQSENLGVQLVFGGINEIRGHSFGYLTFALDGESHAVERGIAAVQEIAEVSRLERVPDDVEATITHDPDTGPGTTDGGTDGAADVSLEKDGGAR